MEVGKGLISPELDGVTWIILSVALEAGYERRRRATY